MTVIRIRCEHRPGVEVALAGSLLRASATTIAPRTLDRLARSQDGSFEDRAAASGHPSGVSPSSEHRAKGALDGLRVVIVEDEDDARELVSIVLSKAGASV